MQFLVRERLSKQQRRGRRAVVAHRWDGSDTLCRMWSTGGLKQASYRVASSPEGAQLCRLCQGEAGPGLDREMGEAMARDAPYLQVGMDEDRSEQAVGALTAPTAARLRNKKQRPPSLEGCLEDLAHALQPPALRLLNLSREELEQGNCDACIRYGNDVDNPVKHDPEDCPNLPLLVHFDGACWPNPGGVLGWGVTITRGKERLVELHDGRPASPSNTNNCAEYCALAAALTWLLEQGHGAARIHVRGDSRLVLRQMFPNGKGRTWRLKAGSYVEHARQAKALLERFSAVTGEWIAREGNRRADALSQQGVRGVAR